MWRTAKRPSTDTRWEALTAYSTGLALAPLRRDLTASDVCTSRGLRAEITRHQPARAISSDPFPQ